MIENDADILDHADARLREWADECEAIARHRTSEVADAAQDRIHQHEKRLERRKKRREKLRARREDPAQPFTPEDAAELHHGLEPEPTAKGKEKDPIGRERRPVLSSRAQQVRRIVEEMPKWMRDPIMRHYRDRLAHRVAARALQLDRRIYQSRLEEAVHYVAERLAERNSAGVPYKRLPGPETTGQRSPPRTRWGKRLRWGKG